eukprot:TRINITY_DN6719_c0_g1_i1.p1 TRINITY_DN6719_c0_g1~~TRINITY_DN6719_c0_g1_i1.p1  ORF type:complete len:188 (+),score=25.57 TRINITY_DN6719_c0_g1_i1:13-576(+)
MSVTSQPIEQVEGAYIFTPPQYTDQRGFFQEHFNSVKYAGKVSEVKQISLSESHANVIRGIHCSQYGKLVQCIKGRIFDVVVDLRSESPTFMKWAMVELSADKSTQVFIPARCGHGFFAAEENSLVVYGQEGTYDPPTEMNVNPMDASLGINWPSPVQGGSYIISDQDRNAPGLEEAKKKWAERNQK